METKEDLHQVMHLKPADKFLVIESLISSLDEQIKRLMKSGQRKLKTD
ncbi:hypothetical protein JYT30_00885 [Desulfotalea psychrophila]|uniref:Uncharacterized protein n=1 Tax=Desulfotalea psychrophila TaxID=84980 RepID=A0ABS3AT72_9BACT|nr:hypothetical protein [Desulfocapsa sp.]MBN4068300.1 hypothetical protein [Desulfotalea psychrophila]MBN4071698.1 hypothetical protein [Desulfotalea psychrophila]